MSKYIRAYDGVIEPEFCKHLIDKFNANEEIWDSYDNDIIKFNQINLPNHPNVFSEEVDFLMKTFRLMVDHYKKDCGILEYQFPQKYGFEAIRMKQYAANYGEFKPHIDAANIENMHRFLVFFLYLDEGMGGETELFDQEVKVERKPGRLLMFPPMWTYPHAGCMPIGTNKHIIGSYLHYIE